MFSPVHGVTFQVIYNLADTGLYTKGLEGMKTDN